MHLTEIRTFPKIIMATALVSGLLLLASVYLTSQPTDAHTINQNCTSAGISLDIRGELQGTSDEAALAYDENGPTGSSVIDYQVTVSLTAAQCPITDGEPSLTLPDGTVVDLDDDLSLASGGSITYDVTGSPYTVMSGDLGSLAGADSDEVRATATVDATSHRASGLDQDVSSSANFDTLVIQPSTITSISSSASQVLAGGTVNLTVTEQNDGDVNLTGANVVVDNGVGTLSAPPTSGDDGDGILEPNETWSWTVNNVVINSDTTFTATGHGMDPFGNDVTYPADPEERDSVTVTVEEVGGEGCTPGYWKQTQHFGSWTTYSPNQQFSAVFENAFPGKTLLQVLSQGGGGLNALGRHTVAALLNAANSDVEYEYTTQEVIDMFNAVYPGGDYQTLHNLFATQNELGCPLGRSEAAA
jgi:hypothetical protein